MRQLTLTFFSAAVCLALPFANATASASSPTPVPTPTSGCTFGIDVRFTESAPVDRFEVTAKGAEPWQIKRLTFDLSKAVGNIIFDPSPNGAGVEAFAPFRETSTSAKAALSPTLADGDQLLTVEFEDFAPDQSYVFTVDIDDQLTNSARGQIQVTGSELAQARVSATVDRLIDYGAGRTTVYVGFFDDKNRAILGDSCD